MSYGDEDDVGYGRPPRYTRFRKGRSGNPAGRPPRKKSTGAAPTDSELDDALRAQLDKEITVQSADGPKKIRMQDAVLLSQQKAALSGNSAAQRDILKAARELEIRDNKREANEKDLDIRCYYRVLNWQKNQRKLWDEAIDKDKDKEPEKPWPHPDDILFDHDRKLWKVRGAASLKHVPHFRKMLALRDYHISSLIVEMRRRGKNRKAGIAIHSLWIVYNMMLPLRWQINEDEFLSLADVLFLIPMKVLRRRAEQDRERAEFWPAFQLSKEENRDVDKQVNAIMRPVLKASGFRSLAHLESVVGTKRSC